MVVVTHTECLHGCTMPVDNINHLFVQLMQTKIILKFVKLLKTFKNYINCAMVFRFT